MRGSDFLGSWRFAAARWAEEILATNPRVPEQFEPKRTGPVLVQRAEEPTSSTPGVILTIVTAVLLLGAILYFMPRSPRGGSAPASAISPSQPAASQLAFSGLKMTPAPTGGAITLDAQLTNSGSSAVNGVMVEIVFHLTNGLRATLQRPVQGIGVGNQSNEGKSADTGKITGDTEGLTKSPIQPNETRPVRIAVDELPKAWNRQIPLLRIIETPGL